MTHSFPTRRSSYLLEQVHALQTRRNEYKTAVCTISKLIKGTYSAQCDSASAEGESQDARNWGHCTSTTTRSEEHTSELQSLMSISYAVFCLKKKTNTIMTTTSTRRIRQHPT